MNAASRFVQGSSEWFDMVGTLVCRAVKRAGYPFPGNWTLIERYSDGVRLPNGLIQGIRFDLRAGAAAYRVGVAPEEQGDATIEVTSAAARTLNLLYSHDPRFETNMKHALDSGAITVEGDLSPIAEALAQSHNDIVDRTC
ncbi:hypothetical protein OCJ37_10290 [Xanthomonas sp. AM6]|uniref:hypothetical protein n=1 Tax=Xanthomonas sp. AM6 TaxID=2982531 RepID=UPI0021DA3F53|nr:hypothetical protein [Xanthomonas sp. AM6]UYB54284.1 hypothetical protein OCJ37_10290 [Xanthomonas sp. AM6]